MGLHRRAESRFIARQSSRRRDGERSERADSRAADQNRSQHSGRCVVAAMRDWRTIKASVRGAAHYRAGLPNQDAVRVARFNDDLPLFVALADGHGSAKCFRSQRGARLAVIVAQQICGQLFKLDGPSQIKRWAEEELPKGLVRRGNWPYSCHEGISSAKPAA